MNIILFVYFSGGFLSGIYYLSRRENREWASKDIGDFLDSMLFSWAGFFVSPYFAEDKKDSKK